MRWLLRKCEKCGRYTLAKDKCPVCGGALRVPHPPRFSPEDRYVKYRIKAKSLESSRALEQTSEPTREHS